MKKVCKFCGQEFETKSTHPSQELYCSYNCKYQQERSKTDRHKIFCSNCGKEFFRSYKPKYNYSYCSIECEREFKFNLKNEERVCPICGTSFSCRKTSSKKLCSPKCQSEWQRRTLVGENAVGFNKNIPLEDRMVTCEICGKTFQTRPYKIETARFCSRQCSMEGLFKLNRSKTTWEERIDTRPQRILNDILDSYGIKYQNEYSIGEYFSVDNYLLEDKLLIEVMGTYWHADIRKYSKINAIQKRDIIQDKRKRTIIQRTLNIPVLYIWEEELLHNKELVEALVLSYISHKGILPNYHSYNFHLENNKCVINDNLIIGYMDRKNNYKELVIE